MIVFSQWRRMTAKVLNEIAILIAGKLADPVRSETVSPAMLMDDEDLRDLPPGTPVVTFSPRAIEMLTEVKELSKARRAAAKPTPKAIRKGSKEWRIQNSKRT